MSRTDRTELMYEGKARQVYATTDPELAWIHFKDDASAFDGAKKAVIGDRGDVNCRISDHLTGLMKDSGKPTHLVEMAGPRGQILLADEVPQDGSRLWGKRTLRKLDEDVLRRDLGDPGGTCRERFARVFGHGLSS